jgi:hypothetical protein
MQVVLLRVILKDDSCSERPLHREFFSCAILLWEQSLKPFQHHSPRDLFNVLRSRLIPFLDESRNFSMQHSIFIIVD